jgi:hypothetical protein
MPDEIDLAQRAEELFLEANLRQVQEAGGRKMQPRGSCYYCSEHLPAVEKDGKKAHERLFCDADCAQGYEAEQRARERRGGR